MISAPIPDSTFQKMAAAILHACRMPPFIARSDTGDVVVTPVSGLRLIRKIAFAAPNIAVTPGIPLTNARRHEQWTHPVRLTPEGLSLSEMKTVANSLIQQKTPLLTFTCHSTSLTPNGNPYTNSIDDVKSLLAKMTAFFDWFKDERNGEIISFQNLTNLYENDRRRLTHH